MQMLDLKQITLTGELAFRLGRNFSRLEDPMYRAPEIFHADQQGWPGDWEGRTILALCLHEQISDRKAAFLDDVLEAMDTRWNEKGYLGQHRTIAEASAVESPIRQETIGFPAHFFARAHNFKPPGRACQPEADSPMRI